MIQDPHTKQGRRPRRSPEARRRLRRHLAGAVAGLLIAAKLISLSVIANLGSAAFASEEYRASADQYSRLHFLNVVDRDIAWFNRGTSHAKGGNLKEGQADLERALELTPAIRECRTRINLALTIEARADELLRKKDWVPALVLLASGQKVVDDGKDCFPPNQGGSGGKTGEEGKEGQQESEAGKELAKASERLDKKSKAANDGESPQDSEGQESDEKDEPQESPPQDKQEQLENQMKDAQKERVRADSQSAALDAEPAEYDDKTW